MKQGLKKYKEYNGERLAKVFAPHSTTSVPTAELLLGWKLRLHLDLVYPKLEGQVEQRQLRQKLCHDGKSKPRSLQIGDLVLIQNHSGNRSHCESVQFSFISGGCARTVAPLSS